MGNKLGAFLKALYDAKPGEIYELMAQGRNKIKNVSILTKKQPKKTQHKFFLYFYPSNYILFVLLSKQSEGKPFIWCFTEETKQNKESENLKVDFSLEGFKTALFVTENSYVHTVVDLFCQNKFIRETRVIMLIRV